MKTLYFHPVNDYSGSTTALANMLEHEYVSGTVDIVTDGQGMLSNLPFVNIIQIPKFGGKRIKGLTYLSKLWGMFVLAIRRRNGYDSYYLNTIMVYPVALSNWFIKKDLTWHIHEKFSYGGNIQSRLEHSLMERIFERTRCRRYFVSNYLLNQYKSNPNCSSEVKYNYLSNSFLKRVEIVPPEKRMRNTVIMIASLTKAKGIDNFIDVAAVLPDIQFILVLSADQERINDYFKNKKLTHNVLIYPKQKDVGYLLRKSDVVINLSIPFFWVETFGMTIIEGMAYGLPAIVPNVGGPAEIVNNGYNGYTIDVTDINGICDAIKKVLEEKTYFLLSKNSLIESAKYK